MLVDPNSSSLTAERAQDLERRGRLSLQAADRVQSSGSLAAPSDDDDETEKNWCTERPMCRPLCRPEIFLVVLCLYVLVQSAVVTGLFSATLSSIERRYAYSNTQMAYVATSYDVAVCVLVAFTSYFGGKYHPPRVLAVGFLLLSIGSLLYSMPQFASSRKYQAAGNLPADFYELCTSNSAAWPSPVDCSVSDKESFVLPLLIIANLIIAMGASPVYTLGTSYIDQIVPKARVPIYLGIFYAISAIGPAIGFLLAGVFLAVWVDPGNSPAGLSKDNQNWVGAWWLGYLIAAIVGFVCCVPMFFFPKYLPGTSEVRKAKEKDLQKVAEKIMENIERRRSTSVAKGVAIAVTPGLSGASFANGHSSAEAAAKSEATVAAHVTPADLVKEVTFLRTAKSIFTNHTYLLLSLGVSFDTIVVASFSAFLASTVQAQYALSASTASFDVGLCIIPGAAGGIFFGGWLLKKLNLGPKMTARLCFIIEIITFCIIFGFIGGCDSDQLAGVNFDYYGSNAVQGNTNDGFNFTYPCNSGCSLPCHQYPFKPVCGNDGVSYYSACYAGCAFNTSKQADGSIYFSQCSCVNPAFGSAAQSSIPVNTMTAKQGMCTNNSCTPLSFYLFFLFFVMFATFSVQVPSLSVTLRSLEVQHRPMGMGVQSFMYRALGTIPGPLALGAILDSACQLWDVRCGDKGSCLDYNNSRMRLSMLLFAFIPKIFAVLSYLAAWLTFPSSRDEKSLISVDIELDTMSLPNHPSSVPEARESPAERIAGHVEAVVVTEHRAERESSEKKNDNGMETLVPPGVANEPSVSKCTVHLSQ